MKTEMQLIWIPIPLVDILDSNGDVVQGYTNLTTCKVTKGVYKVDVNGLTGVTTPCLYYDLWKSLSINSVQLSNVENEFALLPKNGNYKLGSTTLTPNLYGFSFDGIKQNE
jgi:hypothetical protein